MGLISNVIFTYFIFVFEWFLFLLKTFGFYSITKRVLIPQNGRILPARFFFFYHESAAAPSLLVKRSFSAADVIIAHLHLKHTHSHCLFKKGKYSHNCSGMCRKRPCVHVTLPGLSGELSGSMDLPEDPAAGSVVLLVVPGVISVLKVPTSLTQNYNNKTKHTHPSIHLSKCGRMLCPLFYSELFIKHFHCMKYFLLFPNRTKCLNKQLIRSRVCYQIITFLS